MKTAMQELIEWIESNEIVYNKELILKLKELLEKEKEQIIAAREDGNMFYLFKSNEQYLKQTYNN
jgi:predicted  nucleic acid-binding Zn-ribbon protein